ncbi:uncharacterized protein LOC135484073 [Lineus longissimus]|uniref:uncharacterized protein LOC135484073 n=1 Tax=Lineus longissimus TaxID=88925 RepID=UPI002B4F7C96
MMSSPTYRAYDDMEPGDMPEHHGPAVWQYQGPPQYPGAQASMPYYQPAVPPPQAGAEGNQPPPEFQPLVEVCTEKPPRDFLIPSILGCIFCNLWCGSMALAASLLSRGAKNRNRPEEARRRGRHACIFSIIGLTLTLAIIGTIMVLTFAVDVLPRP